MPLYDNKLIDGKSMNRILSTLKSKIDLKLDGGTTVNGYSILDDIVLKPIDIGAAPTVHNHNLSDLSGILPIAKGGTGNTTNTSASCSGNASTATKLVTPRTLSGVAFDGTVNINVPAYGGRAESIGSLTASWRAENILHSQTSATSTRDVLNTIYFHNGGAGSSLYFTIEYNVPDSPNPSRYYNAFAIASGNNWNMGFCIAADDAVSNQIFFRSYRSNAWLGPWKPFVLNDIGTSTMYNGFLGTCNIGSYGAPYNASRFTYSIDVSRAAGIQTKGMQVCTIQDGYRPGNTVFVECMLAWGADGGWTLGTGVIRMEASGGVYIQEISSTATAWTRILAHGTILF